MTAVHIAWFARAMERGRPAYGTAETLPWSDLTSIFADSRRIGDKDGPGFVGAQFALEPASRTVRRLGRNVVARTLIALDCERNKVTGEIPPKPATVADRLRRLGVAGVIYTSHSHKRNMPRYRIVVPLSGAIAPELPTPEVVAADFNVANVLDRSKIGPASLFYLPSAACFDDLDHHEVHVIAGEPYSAAVMCHKAGALSAQRQAEQDRIAAEAHAAAQRRVQERIAAGLDPDDSLIERLRARLDLRSILLSHGYDQQGAKFRHAASQSGTFGSDIKIFGGIERIYSHNGGDPLHRANLPDWCGTVSALDALDVATILDFGGDRRRALRELAVRFGIAKPDERKQLSKLLFRMIWMQAAQEAIELAAFTEGLRLGLSRAEVIQVALWVSSQVIARSAA